MTRPTPEPYFSAYHHLLSHVALLLRARGNELPGEQIVDLGDAIHNVSEFLLSGTWDEPEFRRLYLEPYDLKWGQRPGDFSLVAAVEDGIRRATLASHAT